ncbi:hypothetical protein F4604DRAFT_1685014 [Suillus subluteus]|nr:hypothetical protein F4604DRAFT_1685014 [Suillus subluteus]
MRVSFRERDKAQNQDGNNEISQAAARDAENDEKVREVEASNGKLRQICGAVEGNSRIMERWGKGLGWDLEDYNKQKPFSVPTSKCYYILQLWCGALPSTRSPVSRYTPTHPTKTLPPPFHYPAVALHCPTNLTNTFLMLAPTGAAATIYCSLLIPTSTSCAFLSPSTFCTSTTPALQGQHPATSHHPGTPTQTIPRPSMNLVLHT